VSVKGSFLPHYSPFYFTRSAGSTVEIHNEKFINQMTASLSQPGQPQRRGETPGSSIDFVITQASKKNGVGSQQSHLIRTSQMNFISEKAPRKRNPDNT
jgi:hypothetical protein